MTLVILVLALALIGVLQGIAATHYARGVEALQGSLVRRGDSPNSPLARVLIFPYRDAQNLAEQAQRALSRRTRSGSIKPDRRCRHPTREGQPPLKPATRTVSSPPANDPHGRPADAPRGVGAVRRSVDVLAKDLTVASREALSHRAWRRGGSYAAALLVLEPSSELAARLGAQAQKGEDLSVKLGKAKAAARRGQWRTALRMALAVLAARRTSLGAEAVVADARRALAPKPKPAKTQTASTATPANPPTQPVARPTTPTAPPPPAPP